MSPLMQRTLEEKKERRKHLMALSYPEKVRIVEQMRERAAQIKSTVLKQASGSNAEWIKGADNAMQHAARL